MLLLTGTTDLIQLQTGSATNVDVHTDWMDYNSGTVTPGRTNTQISTATTTTIVGSPTSSTQRNVKSIFVRNTDTANSNAVVIQHTDGSTAVTLCKYVLQPKELLQYVDKFGFVVLDNAGNLKIGPSDSKLIGTTLLTSASGTFTTNNQTNFIQIRVQGGGGQGGGGTGGSSTASTGGGGSAGAYAEKLFAVAGGTGYSYTCGAGGSTSTGNNTGQVGAQSTFTVGSTTVTAPGGNGGLAGGSAGSTALTQLGGAPSSTATGGDINATGEAGGASFRLSGTIAVSGEGGSCFFGAGGNAVNTDVAGNPGVGNGSGGGGATSLTVTSRNGGAGANGCIFVEEYT